MSFFGWGRNGGGGGTANGGGNGLGAEQPGRNLQDGLFQIASQACHILVQINYTHNGGSNNVTNVAYSKHSTAGSSTTLASSSSAVGGSPSRRSFPGQPTPRGEDQDVVVLIPQHKSRTPRIRHRLSPDSEDATLDMNSPGGGDDALGKWDRSESMLRSHADDPLTNARRRARGWCKLICIPITVILILIVLVVLLPLLDHAANKHLSDSTNPGNESARTCMDSCKISLVKTIPSEIVYSNDSVSYPSTYHSWMELIALARSSIEIASLRWGLRKQIGYPDDIMKEGEDVFKAILEAGREKGVRLRFAKTNLTQLFPANDIEYLRENANAQDGGLNYSSLLGAGTLHTKLWLVRFDRTHFYMGSANWHWYSLSQFKELGLLFVNCSCLANDIAKVFDVYWKLSEDGNIPATWPESLATEINLENPMNLTVDGNKYRAFLASSPPALSPKGRTDELEAILHYIDKAEKFVYISVTNYFPLIKHVPKIKYWPIIDDALRSAAIERKVNIRLLISRSTRSSPSAGYFLESLATLTESYKNVKIEKILIVPVPAELERLAHVRINHSKFMVTDIAAYIGTSDWSGDYFIHTAGIAMVFEDVGQKNEGSLRQQLEDIFHRDWNSRYAHPLNEIYSPREIPYNVSLKARRWRMRRFQ